MTATGWGILVGSIILAPWLLRFWEWWQYERIAVRHTFHFIDPGDGSPWIPCDEDGKPLPPA